MATVTRETVIRGHGPPIQAVIGQSAKKVRKTLYERLVSMGMVRHERRRILRDRWPAQDSRHKAEVRGRVIQALMAQTRPDTRSAALIALLHTIRHEPKIVDPRNYGMSKSQLIERGAVIVYSSWAPEAVRIAIDAIIAGLARRAGDGGIGSVGIGIGYGGGGDGGGLAMAVVAMAAMAVEPPPQLGEFGSNRDTRRRQRVDPAQQATCRLAARPGTITRPTVAVRRLAFDRTLPTSEALGKIRDAFRSYDERGIA